MTKMVEETLGFISIIGYAVAVGMIMYVGIRYILAAANEKADLKDSSIRLLIGALMITGASAIFPIMWDIFANVSVTTVATVVATS